MSVPSHRSRRLSGAAVATGLAGSLALALSLGASLSGFTATITNPTNTAAVAALAITETGPASPGPGTATCNSYDGTATCTTINKYGGTAAPLVPGGSQTTTVRFANTGSVAVGTSTLKAGTCVAATRAGVVGATAPTTPNTDPGNLCSVLTVAVYKAATATGPALFSGTLAAFQAATASDLGALAVAANQDYTFIVTLPTAATAAIQGQQVTQPLTWTFNQ